MPAQQPDRLVDRELAPHLVEEFGRYPFATVTGPRQSGKTTLCRTAFPSLRYIDLDAPDERRFVESDPRRFLAGLEGGAILDEVQRTPELLSWLKVLTDEEGRNSRFVLTGSREFGLSDALDQSLAGRTAVLRLLPFSLAERRAAGGSTDPDEILYSGCYPRIHHRRLEPHRALADYFETYVERDVRRLGEIRNLSAFRRFVRLAAGRVGQLLNLTSLGADAGVSHTTARHWMSLLEASYVAFLLPPFHANLRKRLIRSPKLYFHDVGLASHLIGIEHAAQLRTHPLRGPLFENAAVSEALKFRFHRGRRSNLSFYRDSRGLECDLLYESGNEIAAIEIKSGATIGSDFFAGLECVARVVPRLTTRAVCYGGVERQSRSVGEALPIADLAAFLGEFERRTESGSPPE